MNDSRYSDNTNTGTIVNRVLDFTPASGFWPQSPLHCSRQRDRLPFWASSLTGT